MFEENERCPRWDAEVWINRLVAKALNDADVTFYDELDSLAKMELVADVEDKLNINIDLSYTDKSMTFQQFKGGIMEMYKKVYS